MGLRCRAPPADDVSAPGSPPCPSCPQVLSGSLEMTPARSSEAFWREHAGRFEEGNCQLVRVLVKLLEARRDRAPFRPRIASGGEWDIS